MGCETEIAHFGHRLGPKNHFSPGRRQISNLTLQGSDYAHAVHKLNRWPFFNSPQYLSDFDQYKLPNIFAMPSVAQNKEFWKKEKKWETQGEEWSEAWGGSLYQWLGAIYPRIHRFIPCEAIVEIAPGYGRWTQYLLQYSKQLSAFDLTEQCVEYCRARFSQFDHCSFSVNDGRSLPSVADGSADFVFSFDSLVHAEIEVIEVYLAEISRVLKPEGGAFIHHSNLKAFPKHAAKAPATLTHWRAGSVSAEEVALLGDRYGLVATAQECINWGCKLTIDCFSTFAKFGSQRSGKIIRTSNPEFMEEARLIKRRAQLYS